MPEVYCKINIGSQHAFSAVKIANYWQKIHDFLLQSSGAPQTKSAVLTNDAQGDDAIKDTMPFLVQTLEYKTVGL